MDLVLVLLSFILGIFVLVAVGKLFTIAHDLRRLVMLELCSQGAFDSKYCDAYKATVAEKVRVPFSAIQSSVRE
jgi:hypothetical protein